MLFRMRKRYLPALFLVLYLVNFKVVSAQQTLPFDQPYPVSAADESIPLIRWFYGISFGMYVPSNSTANYYSGSGEHSVENALNQQWNYDRIVRHLDEVIENFRVYELPTNMRYSPGLQVGFYGGLNFSNSFAVLGEFNYTRLIIADRFTIETDRETFTTEPYLVLSDISGTEERIELRLGFQYTMLTNGSIHPFLESGLNITDVKVIENRVNIKGLTINIRDFRGEYYNIRDYGMGLGVFTGVGLKMDVSDAVAIRTGASVSFSRINLGDNNKINPQFTAYLRLNLNDVFAPAVN